ncbi:divergent polysaccharide deacetylase family protein [Roseinatronobacter sp. S2]|uniref:divergent polysaccharide deacetylase family protein n=1 Tax=Roseinatronobacter sp. S2 TaxID=3035471 RepID=UPI00241028B0|nr:divergent polysaccharide deacetylase family protein [Roseinatronobacter sp. S2]WFE76433.1 divergent polysaccharide deacetylase family protein [Roseinatronobacter sp. S2]
MGVAGFGLGLAIAAVGVVGLAVVFPPSVPEQPATIAAPEIAGPEGDTPPQVAAPADDPAAPEGPPPDLVLSDDADQPENGTDAARDADTMPDVAQPPDVPRPVVTSDMAQLPRDPADDHLSPMPETSGGASRAGELPVMGLPLAPSDADMSAPDMPAPAAPVSDMAEGAQVPADMPEDAAPSTPQQDSPLAMLAPAQGTGAAPRAPDGVPQVDAPPLPAPERADSEDASGLDDDLPQAPTPGDDSDSQTAQDAPPEDGTADSDAPADGGVAMPGTRISGMPGLPLSPRDAVPSLAAAGVVSGADATDLADDAIAPSALERNAIAVGAPDGALMAIVLNDPGLPMPLRRALAARDTVFTVALNPMDPSATEAAELYHQAGKEVLILANGIPAGATASDIDVTFGAYFDNLPLAAGVIDLPQNGFVRNSRLLADVMDVIVRDGYGLVTFAGGLGQAARSADAMGVPHAEVFRILDTEDESAITIRRFLDRAVFQASQVGHVIVFGEASNEATLDALDLWQSEGRVDQISLVPVSAILLGR